MRFLNRSIIILILLIPLVKTYSQNDSLIISEVMFFPSASNSEFIEIYNQSYQNSADISKFQIIYSTANADTIIAAENVIVIPPRSFAVVFEGDYDLNAGIYSSIVPSEAVRLQIDNNAFGSSGMANTSDRIIYLVNAYADTLDVYTYSANNSSGISDEKIILSSDSSSTNWANSITHNGTPGSDNSVSPKQYDLSVTDLFFTPAEIYEGDEVQFNVVVKNIGTLISSDFSAYIFVDINKDSTAQQNEIIVTQNFTNLSPEDSIHLIEKSNKLPAGSYDLYAIVDYALDEKISNNIKTINVDVFPKLNSYNDIIISEIMYGPIDGEPEWIEIYNKSDSAINLNNWRIADKVSSAMIYDSTFKIPPHEYVVLSDNENIHNYYSISAPVLTMSLPSLNNDGDNIKLLDSLKRAIDSVNYNSNWGGQGGYSLEKIQIEEDGNNSTNWGSSISYFGGTPGKVNSITPKENDLAVNNFYIESDVVFIGETAIIHAVVKNIGVAYSENYFLQIFHDTNADSTSQENELVYQFNETGIAPNDSAALSVELYDYNVGINYYIAKLISDSDLNNDNNFAFLSFVGVERNEIRNDIVINEIMYAPNSPEPEWIELFNRSDKVINLKNYQIADKADTAEVISDDIMFQPHQYYVIAKDSIFITIYSDTLNFIISTFPNLNNTGDRLMILDSLDRMIDSLDFNPNWGGKNGVSLERIDSELSSIDSTNWESAKLVSGGTPGIINSITPREFDLVIDQFHAENDYVIIGETVKINTVVKNVGKRISTSFRLKIFHDINADSVAQENELIYQFDENALTPNDSADLRVELNDYNVGQNFYIAEVIYDEDLNVENNFAYLNIIGVEINEIRNDIVINEIMYAPNKPEPEWIELFNRSDKTINLRNYQIADNVDTMKVIDDDMIFLPRQYYIITKDSSFITVYNDTLNFIISDFPNLNNTGDRLFVLDSLKRVIDSLEFNPNWGGKNGRSLERFDSELLSIDSTNWKSTKLDSGGTPGFINSITQRDFDIAISQINYNPSFPLYGERVRISAKLKNIGKNILTCSLKLFEDVDLDTANFQLLETSNLIELNNDDSINVEFNFTIDSIKETHAFLIEIISTEDQDSSNNKFYSEISLGYPPKTLVINEIMYSPINGEPEWIEFYNTSKEEVNLNSWVVSDIYTTPKVVEITKHDLLIQGNEYFVISKDSTIWEFHKTIPSPILIEIFANMNNDIDGVVLKDQYGNLIDSVEYKSSWGGTSGYSLERRFRSDESNDSTNWNSSIDIELSTPGRENSITPKNFDLKVSAVIPSPEFPTINENVYVNLVIHNVGINEVNNFSVSIKLLKNNHLSELELLNNLSLKSGDSLMLKTENSFTLDDSVKVTCRVILDLDNDTTNNCKSIMLYPSFLKKSIIINEFMANPNTDEAEWVELYNNSENPINIKNWSISDLLTSPSVKRITKEEVIIQQGEYFIIANDTSKFHVKTDAKIFSTKFGTLGNIDDGIVLYDFNKKVIDSLRYDKDWDIEKGRSLERVSFDASTIDAYNWLPSLSVTGSTPGSNNSILETQPYAEGNIKINEIMFDPDNNNSEFIELYNNTDSSVDIGGWSMTDASDNYFELSKTFYELSPNGYFIFAADSMIFDFYQEIQNNSAIIISNTGDLSLSNDEETITIMDHWGTVIDSINYNSKWHNKNINISKNKSLERINPNLDGNDKTNWSTSVDPIGATPIKQNSIYTEGNSSEAKLSFSPNPFSPDNDGYEDFTLISYNLSVSTAQIRIKIFDDKGRLVRTLVNNKAAASKGTEIFDGLDDNGNPLRIGMYIVFIEASNSTSGIVDVLKDVIVIARKL